MANKSSNIIEAIKKKIEGIRDYKQACGYEDIVLGLNFALEAIEEETKSQDEYSIEILNEIKEAIKTTTDYDYPSGFSSGLKKAVALIDTKIKNIKEGG